MPTATPPSPPTPSESDRLDSLASEAEGMMTFDEILAQIDEKLPAIHLMAVEAEADGSPPTPAGVSIEAFKRAQKLFRKLSQEPLLTDDQSDIRITQKVKRSKGRKDADRADNTTD